MMWGILVAALIFGSLGADAEANKGITPLHTAALANDFATAEVLLKTGADVNAKANKGITPLHAAAAANASATAEVLLKTGADVNAKANGGVTPLHLAAAADASETAEVLLKAGADANAKNNDGYTPLGVAAAMNASATAEVLDRYASATAEVLPEAGADPASSGGHEKEEVVRIIRAIGRIDTLLAQGQPDQALKEYEEIKGVLVEYMQGRLTAGAYNSIAEATLGPLYLYDGPFSPEALPFLGNYRSIAGLLQKSLAGDPTQKPLFEILTAAVLEIVQLYDYLAVVFDKLESPDTAHDFRERAKDRRHFVETIEAALEPLRKKSKN